MIDKLGRYEILAEIGRGGFAIVYRARDTELDRIVALKELKPALLQDTAWVKRFRREARAIAKLDHPRIVPIYDVGQVNERIFLVMRLVDGPSLAELIDRQSRLPWPEVVELMTALAEGLDYAHGQGILHRDLKPANILIDLDRGPLLTDFGLAKLAGESSTSVSATGSVVGSPHYIAPEVWEGQAATPQGDIYALGCILYEMLLGEKVFKGESAPAVMMAHFKPLALPGEWAADVPAGISEVIKTALAHHPADRYATAGAMAAALAALGQAEAIKPTPPPIITGSPDDEQPQPQRPAPPPEEQFEADIFAVEPESDEAEAATELLENDSANTWRSFMKHLGSYVIIIGALGFINLLASPDSLWFLWPAIGWGVGLAFHLRGVIMNALTIPSEKWRKFIDHVSAYGIISGLLIGIYLLAGGGDPWFLWPVGIWGAAVLMHLWATIMSKDQELQAQAERRVERRAARRDRLARRRMEKMEIRAGRPEPVASTAIQAHLDKARTYKKQIDALVKAAPDSKSQVPLQDLARQVEVWTQAIEALVKRIDGYQHNSLIQHDLATVPQSIQKLEAQLAQETDEATRAELTRTLANRKNQLAALQQLQNMMKRAELKIESTLSSLGTIYPQLLTSQSTNHVADYSRLSEEVDEEVRTLQDHLEALEEVKLGLK